MMWSVSTVIFCGAALIAAQQFEEIGQPIDSQNWQTPAENVPYLASIGARSSNQCPPSPKISEEQFQKVLRLLQTGNAKGVTYDLINSYAKSRRTNEFPDNIFETIEKELEIAIQFRNNILQVFASMLLNYRSIFMVDDLQNLHPAENLEAIKALELLIKSFTNREVFLGRLLPIIPVLRTSFVPDRLRIMLNLFGNSSPVNPGMPKIYQNPARTLETYLANKNLPNLINLNRLLLEKIPEDYQISDNSYKIRPYFMPLIDQLAGTNNMDRVVDSKLLWNMFDSYPFDKDTPEFKEHLRNIRVFLSGHPKIPIHLENYVRNIHDLLISVTSLIDRSYPKSVKRVLNQISSPNQLLDNDILDQKWKNIRRYLDTFSKVGPDFQNTWMTYLSRYNFPKDVLESFSIIFKDKKLITDIMANTKNLLPIYPDALYLILGILDNIAYPNNDFPAIPEELSSLAKTLYLQAKHMFLYNEANFDNVLHYHLSDLLNFFTNYQEPKFVETINNLKEELKPYGEVPIKFGTSPRKILLEQLSKIWYSINENETPFLRKKISAFLRYLDDEGNLKVYQTGYPIENIDYTNPKLFGFNIKTTINTPENTNELLSTPGSPKEPENVDIPTQKSNPLDKEVPISPADTRKSIKGGDKNNTPDVDPVKTDPEPSIEILDESNPGWNNPSAPEKPGSQASVDSPSPVYLGGNPSSYPLIFNNKYQKNTYQSVPQNGQSSPVDPLPTIYPVGKYTKESVNFDQNGDTKYTTRQDVDRSMEGNGVTTIYQPKEATVKPGFGWSSFGQREDTKYMQKASEPKEMGTTLYTSEYNPTASTLNPEFIGKQNDKPKYINPFQSFYTSIVGGNTHPSESFPQYSTIIPDYGGAYLEQSDKPKYLRKPVYQKPVSNDQDTLLYPSEYYPNEPNLNPDYEEGTNPKNKLKYLPSSVDRTPVSNEGYTSLYPSGYYPTGSPLKPDFGKEPSWNDYPKYGTQFGQKVDNTLFITEPSTKLYPSDYHTKSYTFTGFGEVPLGLNRNPKYPQKSEPNFYGSVPNDMHAKMYGNNYPESILHPDFVDYFEQKENNFYPSGFEVPFGQTGEPKYGVEAWKKYDTSPVLNEPSTLLGPSEKYPIGNTFNPADATEVDYWQKIRSTSSPIGIIEENGRSKHITMPWQPDGDSIITNELGTTVNPTGNSRRGSPLDAEDVGKDTNDEPSPGENLYGPSSPRKSWQAPEDLIYSQGSFTETYPSNFDDISGHELYPVDQNQNLESPNLSYYNKYNLGPYGTKPIQRLLKVYDPNLHKYILKKVVTGMQPNLRYLPRNYFPDNPKNLGGFYQKERYTIPPNQNVEELSPNKNPFGQYIPRPDQNIDLARYFDTNLRKYVKYGTLERYTNKFPLPNQVQTIDETTENVLYQPQLNFDENLAPEDFYKHGMNYPMHPVNGLSPQMYNIPLPIRFGNYMIPPNYFCQYPCSKHIQYPVNGNMFPMIYPTILPPEKDDKQIVSKNTLIPNSDLVQASTNNKMDNNQNLPKISPENNTKSGNYFQRENGKMTTPSNVNQKKIVSPEFAHITGTYFPTTVSGTMVTPSIMNHNKIGQNQQNVSPKYVPKTGNYLPKMVRGKTIIPSNINQGKIYPKPFGVPVEYNLGINSQGRSIQRLGQNYKNRPHFPNSPRQKFNGIRKNMPSTKRPIGPYHSNIGGKVIGPKVAQDGSFLSLAPHSYATGRKVVPNGPKIAQDGAKGSFIDLGLYHSNPGGKFAGPKTTQDKSRGSFVGNTAQDSNIRGQVVPNGQKLSQDDSKSSFAGLSPHTGGQYYPNGVLKSNPDKSQGSFVDIVSSDEGQKSKSMLDEATSINQANRIIMERKKLEEENEKRKTAMEKNEAEFVNHPNESVQRISNSKSENEYNSRKSHLQTHMLTKGKNGRDIEE